MPRRVGLCVIHLFPEGASGKGVHERDQVRLTFGLPSMFSKTLIMNIASLSFALLAWIGDIFIIECQSFLT